MYNVDRKDLVEHQVNQDLWMGGFLLPEVRFDFKRRRQLPISTSISPSSMG
jgi:hypothetical protein